jgi:diguanylate cyclase (GGDEF)-like protein/PAS domain S-box-containing protein
MTRPPPLSLVQTLTHRDRPDDRLLAVARNLPAVLFELHQSHDGRVSFRYVSEGVRTLLPIGPDEAIAEPARVFGLLHPEDRVRVAEAMACAARDGTHWHDEFRTLRDGDLISWLEVDALPSAQADGSLLWHGWFIDVTARRSAQLALADSERRHRQLFASNPIPMWVHDLESLRFLTVNDAAVAHYGYSRDEFLAMTVAELRNGGGAEPAAGAGDTETWPDRTITVHHRLKSGRVVEVELTSQPLVWDGRPARLVMAVDVTARRRAEAEIQRLAYFDTLTQLPNRRLLSDRLRQSLAATQRTGTRGAVLVVDLDGFKRVNETRGHRTGDEVLVEIAARLKSCIRTEDTVARLAADEFVVVLERLGSEPRQAAAHADEAAQRIVTALSRPFDLQGARFHASASVGVAMFGDPVDLVEDLLMHADSAMHRAKASGRGTIRFYDPAMQVALQSRAALEADLRRALSEGQLRLAYQAQVDAHHRTVGAEVLLRWQHPDRGPIPPMAFIPLAEETGLIVPIGQWVLETACTQLAGWARNAVTRDLRLSVNVSARQFRQPDFVHRVERALSDSGAVPSRLRLELTESLLLDNINDCIAKMQSLKSIGVGFSLDDFGTGYSSLSYLKRLPLDELKIDRSFIRDIATDPSDAVIVQTIIGMANNLGLTVIAEGVETIEQVEFLGRNGCGAYQGWLFGKPVPVSEFEGSIQQQADAREAAEAAATAARASATSEGPGAPAPVSARPVPPAPAVSRQGAAMPMRAVFTRQR